MSATSKYVFTYADVKYPVEDVSVIPVPAVADDKLTLIDPSAYL